MRKVRGIGSSWVLAVALGLLFLTSALAQAQISVVVSAKSGYTPSDTDIKSYFKGVKLTWPDGEKVQVLDQPDSDIAKIFYEKFLETSVSQIRKDWTKLVLSGQAAAPVKCASDDEVKKALTSSTAAIGFIATSSLDDSVKEIAKVE